MAKRGRPVGWRKHHWTKEELEKLYWKEEKSCYQIGRQFGLRGTSVNKAMEKLGIPRRQVGSMKGRSHPNWKGGRSKSGSGYIIIHKPEHHRARKNDYVFEHIVVWEEAHHQPLPDGWVVHHLNGVKDDNRPKNLLGMPKSGHSPALTMKEVQKRLREVEAQLWQQRLW